MPINTQQYRIDVQRAIQSIQRLNQAIATNTRTVQQNTQTLIQANQQTTTALNQLTTQLQQTKARTRQATVANNEFGRSLNTISRIATGFTIHRVFFAILNSIEGSLEKAKEFHKAIAEIQTISQSNAQSTRQWSDQLLELSKAYGVDVIELAKGEYQALSNQVITAGNSTAFMTEEIKLSITAIGSLSQAVDATSSVIKAYGLTSRDAAQINAILFKTVELGRIKLEELGSGYGKLNVISKQLGVTQLESHAALAELTVKGVEADAALTLLQNVMLHLIKPSKEMTRVLDTYGVSSGHAAVETFGFIGLLKKLAQTSKESKDETNELALLFKDLRAIVGAQGLVQSLDGLEASFEKLKNATNDYNNAVKIVLENISTRANVQLAKVNAEFIKIGESLLNFAVNSAEAFGGADKALNFLLKTVRIAAELYVGYLVATRAVTLGTKAFTAATNFSKLGLIGKISALQGVRAALLGVVTSEAAATLGISVAITVVAEAVIRWQNYEQTVKDAGMQARATADVINSTNLTQFNNTIDKVFNNLDDAFDMNIKALFQWAASIQATNNALNQNFDKTFKAIGKNIDSITDGSLKRLQKELDKQQKIVDKLKAAAEKTAETAKSRILDEDTRKFDRFIDDKTDLDKIKFLEARKADLFKRAGEARAAGDRELNSKLLDELEKNADEQEKVLENLKKEAEKVKETVIKNTKVVRVRDPITRKFHFEEKTTTKTVSAPDEATIADAQRRAVALELQRREIVHQRITEELEFAAKSEATAKAEEAKLAARTIALQKFKEVLAKLDSIDPSTDSPDKLHALITEADNAAKVAGLTGKERIEFLRQAQAQELVLRRKFITSAVNDELNITTKALEEAKKRREVASKQQVDTVKSAEEKIGAFIADSQEKLGVLTQINTGGFGQTLDTAFQNQINDVQKSLNLLQEGMKTGKIDLDLLADFQQRLEKLNTEHKVKLGENRTSTDLNLQKTPFEKLNEDGTKTKLLVIDILRGLEKSFEIVIAEQEKITAANRAFDETIKQLNLIQQSAARIPPEYRKIGDSAKTAAEEAIKSAEDLNTVYNQTIDRLERVIQLQQEALRSGPEGSVPVPSKRAPEDDVSFQRRPSLFQPTQLASNRSVSFGDIVINPSSGTSDAQAGQIATKLVRLTRRGLYSI